MGTSTLCPRASPQHTWPHQLDQREHGLTLPGVASIPRVQLARGPPGLPFLLSEVGWALVGGSPPERLKALPGTALTPHLDACWWAPCKTSPVALTATPSRGICSLFHGRRIWGLAGVTCPRRAQLLVAERAGSRVGTGCPQLLGEGVLDPTWVASASWSRRGRGRSL